MGFAIDWAIGEWAESHWIIGVTSFQKIYGLYSVEHHKVEKWPYKVGGFCGYGGSVWVMGEWAVGYWIVSVTSFHKIYGLYSVGHRKVDISGDVTKVGRTDGRTNKQQRKIQLLRF